MPSGSSHGSAPDTAAGALPRRGRRLWGRLFAGICGEIGTGLSSSCRAARPQAPRQPGHQPAWPHRFRLGSPSERENGSNPGTQLNRTSLQVSAGSCHTHTTSNRDSLGTAALKEGPRSASPAALRPAEPPRPAPSVPAPPGDSGERSSAGRHPQSRRSAPACRGTGDSGLSSRGRASSEDKTGAATSRGAPPARGG